MDAPTMLRKRVGGTPLVQAPGFAKAVRLPGLRLKMEGANPTGTQKDRVARLEASQARADGTPGICVASCGNFGVAIAHAAYVHGLACQVSVPEHFTGERVATMEALGAEVERVPGQYEDAVEASRQAAQDKGWYDANPGGANTLRTLVGYAAIAEEIVEQMGAMPVAVGVPVGNGSTLAGVHLGFRQRWAEGPGSMPVLLGGSSEGNNPLPEASKTHEALQLDPKQVHETAINEPLCNWHALDGQACLLAMQDSGGAAYGASDERLLALQHQLADAGVDAHPASLAAVTALQDAADAGLFPRDAPCVAVLTSGRPQISVARMDAPPADMEAFIAQLREWLGRFRDPVDEVDEAVEAAFAGGHVLVARDLSGDVGYCVLTPMELSTFFPRFHLSYIAVSKPARGRGLGTVLLEEAIRITQQSLSLHVETDNERAIRLYEKFGFERKYYRMIFKGHRTPEVDPAAGAGWERTSERGTSQLNRAMNS